MGYGDALRMMGGGQLAQVENVRQMYGDSSVFHGRKLLVGLHACIGFDLFLALGMAFLYCWHIFQHIYIEPLWAVLIIAAQLLIAVLGLLCSLGLSPLWKYDNHWIYGVGAGAADDRHANDAYNWNLFTASLALVSTLLAQVTPLIWVWALHGDVIKDRATWDASLLAAANVAEALPALLYLLYFVAACVIAVGLSALLMRTGHTWFSHKSHSEFKTKGY